MVDEVQEIGEFFFGALSFFVAGDGFGEIGDARGDVFEDGEIGVEFEFLGEVADAEFTAEGDVAGVGFGLAGEDFEEGGFSAAIAADHPDFLTRFHRESDAVEEVLMAVGEGEFVSGKKHGLDLKK